MKEKKVLNTGWEFRLLSSENAVMKPDEFKLSDKWFPAAVPGTVHTDLLNNGIIENPFYSDYELNLEWIDNCDWEYRKYFDIANTSFDLICFEGIDTIGEIYLNNKLLGKCKNMFHDHEYEIKDKLISGLNELRIVLLSAKRIGKQLELEHGKLPVALASERVYLRKAQYSFGWDWGPGFITAGIWKDVWLKKTTEYELTEVLINTKNIKENYAELDLSFVIKGNLSNCSKVKISMECDDSKFEMEFTESLSSKNKYTIRIENPKLWNPNGLGEPNLYSLKILLIGLANNELCVYKQQVGIRTVELRLLEEAENTFKFIINGNPLFIKGVNWIPADSFLPRVKSEKYRELLTLAKEANVNMVRVWGGGIYEDNSFYELCDKLGLLVWQDFMFACGAYPEHDDFINNITNEFVFQIKRLRNHPSLAVWCGNNENEWGWYQKNPDSKEEIPGSKIYKEVIPDVLAKLDNLRPYWRSSPFGLDEDPNSFKSGNTHQWDIWSSWKDYDEVKNDNSLFVTEFGFQGPANPDTLNEVIPEADRKIQSKIFEHHNKQVEGPERIIRFLAKHLLIKTKWEEYIYLTQLNQGFALKTCLEHWRTNGKTNGSIIWQLNDCWPVTSWSIIDSEMIPKLAYYFVKNIFAQQLVYFKNIGNEIHINLQNQSNKNFSGSYKITFIDSVSGSIEETFLNNFTIDSNSAEKVKSFTSINKNTIILAGLYNHKGNLINSNFYNSQSWKYFKPVKPAVTFDLIGENQIIIRTDKPAYFVDLYADGVLFSNRGFSILPDEEIKVDILNKKNKDSQISDIKIFSLNQFLNS
ncbi:MAG: glycoside hydrolase family 2 protein [Melioribacteraceae bacterium]|nr:glycoside hydrolase family 2 protein [Melioribacteraceae bacterium]